MKEESDEAIDYFYLHLPRILANEPDLKYKICIQKPGDTIYVPEGWWHAVLNLTDTIAVTQNYMNSVNFKSVWRSLRVGRKVFSSYFLKVLRKKNPSLYYKAKMINIQDNFVMYNVR